jgi:hypothetical protein
MVCLVSCRSKEESSLDKLLQTYDKQAAGGKSVVMIVPLDGCGTCIASSISYAKDNADNQNLTIIASTLGKKKIEMFFGDSIMGKSNFIPDVNCMSEALELVGTATSVYYLENGRIVRKATIKPENSDSLFQEINKWN